MSLMIFLLRGRLTSWLKNLNDIHSISIAGVQETK